MEEPTIGLALHNAIMSASEIGSCVPQVLCPFATASAATTKKNTQVFWPAIFKYVGDAG